MTIEETKEKPDNSAGVLTRKGNETTHNNHIDVCAGIKQDVMPIILDFYFHA